MSEKKDLGQFITNPTIAKFMNNLGITDKTRKILDPATGPGTFIKNMDNAKNNMNITVFEVDIKMLKLFKQNIDKDCLIYNEDYLLRELKDKYDYIICNPPYNKFQKIPQREQLIKEFERKYGIKMSGYSNYCVYFLVKSMNELAKDGKCVYIIPYEFLNCGYGEVIKKYLLDKKMLKSIIKFDNSLKLFNDATTTSCIIVLENSIHDEVEFVNITNVDEINNINKFQDVKTYKYFELDIKEKWIKYFKNDNNMPYKNLIQIKNIGAVKRGIATGSNSYFTLNKEKIKNYNISKEACLPCISKSPDVKEIVFNKKTFDELYENNKAVYLFNGVNAQSSSDFEYIKMGEDNDIDKLYLTSHRTPWYSIEKKDSAPIWISVFSRNKLKIIRNEMMINNLTTFHGMYFNNMSKEEIDILFCYLLTPIGQEILYMNKREYGEGLDKFEPNDLNNAMILDIKVISENDKNKILKIYNNINSNKEKCIMELNDIFKKYLLDE